MKKTSKLLSLLLALTLVLSLAACGGGSGSETTDLTGTTWVLSGGSQGDTTVDKETLEGMFGGEMTYAFEADGKVTLSLAGVSVEGTWSQDGNSVTVDIQGDTGTMTLDGDKLTIEESGVTVEFSKK
ncbi:hypothetical protein [Intestinimonas sp. HCP28S3_D6]|uniref:hypothetical protein n=1 Tax=Intestinimonas sp. HCP28S3_D6 TaxID=3438942 RepID=UPI003F88C342